MAHQFSFINDINNLVTMDEPITKGPPPRWQKSCMESSNSSINVSLNSSKNRKLSVSVSGNVSSKTPSKKSSMELKKTPRKTPGKSPANFNTSSHADRFIPNRSGTNFEISEYLMQNEDKEEELVLQKEKERIISETLHGNDINKMRVLSYKNKAPPPPDGYMNHLKVVYSQSKTPGSVKSSLRYITQTPDRILDAPQLTDDYYLNLVDWGSNNILAVALAHCVFLWNGSTGAIEQLLELEGNDSVCSVAWIQDGNILAVGTNFGVTQLWDCSAMKRIRSMGGHTDRVGSHSWNQHILSSGSRSGAIFHHDVRKREHVVNSLTGHTLEVCGLKWSADGRYLASGGNDNILNVWPLVRGELYSQGRPLYQFTSHQAAVKAVAWCPWQHNILASGGGTADRCIRLWNVNTGNMLKCIDTKSQVCALQWASNFKELVSGHGFANNQVSIWKYPDMTRVAELTGHTFRILQLCMSPDGHTVLSASADETLRLWKCFVPDPAKKSSKKNAPFSYLKQSLR